MPWVVYDRHSFRTEDVVHWHRHPGPERSTEPANLQITVHLSSGVSFTVPDPAKAEYLERRLFQWIRSGGKYFEKWDTGPNLPEPRYEG